MQRRVRWDKSSLPVQGLDAPSVSVGREGSTGHDEFGGGNWDLIVAVSELKKEIPVQSVVVHEEER